MKTKPIKGWMQIFEVSGNTLVTKEPVVDCDIKVVVIPLADYKQMQRDHEAQLLEAARLVDCADCRFEPLGCHMDRKQLTVCDKLLKHFKQIKAVK